jgi:hypothetical protein
VPGIVENLGMDNALGLPTMNVLGIRHRRAVDDHALCIASVPES